MFYNKTSIYICFKRQYYLVISTRKIFSINQKIIKLSFEQTLFLTISINTIRGLPRRGAERQ